MTEDYRESGIAKAIFGNGISLLILTGLALFASGGFVIFQSLTGHFLPHDTYALGMDAEELSQRATKELVLFMFHDRVAFGGVLLTIGALYCWMSLFPLKHGEVWAWWALAISGTTGFLSFLSYFGYGYLDQWHGVATLLLLPVLVAGLVLAQRSFGGVRSFREIWSGMSLTQTGRIAFGRFCLMSAAVGLVSAGAVILVIGMSTVFVPQDLEYIGLSAYQMQAVAPNLIPIIAHDRAGFGGGLVSSGLLIFLISLNARVTANFIEIMTFTGGVGFGCAIVVHHVIGYTDVIHLLPAYLGFILFAVGMTFLVLGWKTRALCLENDGGEA